jgi:DNA-binding CsgD family transcriptional regulator
MSDGCVITFYSYKGGVGRSFVQANVAATLSRWGYRVLCVDWDLEAPGLAHYFDPWVQDSATRLRISAKGKGVARLTPREALVLSLAGEGLSDAEIAARLGSSERTVRIHLSMILAKTGARNRSEAVELYGGAEHGDLLADNPGLASAALHRPGLLELIEAFTGGNQPDYRPYLMEVCFPEPHVRLMFLGAGRQGKSYMARLQRLNWARMYAEQDLGQYIESLRARWVEEFDFVLVDSRTGVSDTGGICTVQLPDMLVVVLAANQQNLDGATDVVAKCVAQRNELPYDRQGLITIPVLSRFDQRSEYELTNAWLERVQQHTAPLLETWIHREVSAAQFFEQVRVPYFSVYSFGEDLPALEPAEQSGPERITHYFDTLAALLVNRGAGTEKLVVNRDTYVAVAKAGRAKPAESRYKVYISYSRGDADFARVLDAELRRLSVPTFFDESEVTGTGSEAVADALGSSESMVALIGKGATRWQIENIRMFLRLTIEEGRRVVPVILPGATALDVPRFLRQFQGIDASQGMAPHEVASRLIQLAQHPVAQWLRDRTTDT